MARIYGSRSFDPRYSRPLAQAEIAPVSGTGFPSGQAQAPGFFGGWLDHGRPALRFENERYILVGDGVVFRIEGAPGAELGAFLARSLEKGTLAEALTKVNGDFAFAWYDKSARSLCLVRDRFGVKPLYFAQRGGDVAFGSLPQAAAKMLGIPLEPRKAYVARFLAAHYRYFDNDEELSPYDGVSQVAPGQIVRFSEGRTEKLNYWQLENGRDLQLPEAELAEKYRSLLLDAVDIRLKATKQRAFTLSGGMDSSSVLGSSRHLLGATQIAYSSVYEDKTYDESDDIQSMLTENVSEWRSVPIVVDRPFTAIAEMVRVHQEPVVTATWLSHFLLCRQAAKDGVASLFGGLGGDELNAGEYEYFWYFFADLKTQKKEALLADEIAAWVRYHDHPVFKKSAAIAEQNLPLFADMRVPGRCLPDLSRLNRYRAALLPSYYDLDRFAPLMPAPFESYLKNRCYQDLRLETTPPCLRAEDRQGAFFGLENSLPFLDHRLVELMFQVPGTLKFRSGVTKHLLREAMKGILPEETRTRVKKTGWNAPAHIWFSGAGREQLLDMVHSSGFRNRGLYNVAEVERLIGEHEEIVSGRLTKDNHMMFLWQLVNLELWLQSLS